MPVPDGSISFPSDVLRGDHPPGPSILCDLYGRPKPRAIGPAEVLDAVEAMDDRQRARLAELLGVEAAHPLLCLPRRDRGGLTWPTIRADDSVPAGVCIMVDRDGRELGRIHLDGPATA